jgi:glutamyl-tRNA reductase
MDKSIRTKIAVIGINHKRASLEIRERFSLTETQQKLLLSELKNRPDVIEAFVLSTCNRVEIYANLLNPSQDPFFLVQIICQIKKIDFTPYLREYFYGHTDVNAVRHFLRVTAGLDSLILGEKQILGQVKMAVAQAQEYALFQQSFNILSNIAIRAGKKAQTETDISWGGASVGWAAVIRAEKLLGSLENKIVLVIGAGKMSQLALQQMNSRGIQELYLMNRTHEKAAPLAQTYNARCVSLHDLKDILTKVDLCISAVAAPHHIIEKDLLESVMVARSQRPLMIIDIAVPRNVAPEATQIKNLTVCTVDDLDEVIAQTITKRQSAMLAVENIVENKLTEFYDKMQKIKNLDESFNSLGA